MQIKKVKGEANSMRENANWVYEKKQFTDKRNEKRTKKREFWDMKRDRKE